MRIRFPILALLAAIACLPVSPDEGYGQAAGDITVFFEAAPAGDDGEGDVDIYAQRLTDEGKLVWNEGKTPVAVATSVQRETSPAACVDGEGGAIVAFVVEYIEGDHAGDIDICAQRIDARGKALWNEGEMPPIVAGSEFGESLPIAVSDGAGGAIIVYEWMDDKGDRDILAQRIDRDGKLVWHDGDRPAIIAASDGIERAPVVVPDGRGGLLVVFEWEGANGDVDVMAQRVTADGKVPWNGGDQAIDVASGTALERHPVAVPDGKGGALVAFEFEFPEGEHKGDVDIAAQRISNEGVRLWNGGERPVVVSSASAIERRPAAVADGAGGAIIAFEYEPLEGDNAGDVDVLAQRVDGDGSLLWNGGERPSIVTALPGLERSLQAIPTGDGSVLVILEHEFRGGEFGGDIDIMASHLSPTGESIWSDETQPHLIASSDWLEVSPVALPDGNGGAIVVCTTIGPEGEWEGDSDLAVARLSRGGELLWNDGKTPIRVAGGRALERSPSVVIGAR